MTSVSRMARRVFGTIAMTGAALIAVGCAGEAPLSANLTTLYIFADYATPNVTVSVNGKSLGTLLQQYTGALDCTTLAAQGVADGVVSIPVNGGVHYSLNWTFSSGKTDADAFDATPDFFQVPCLLEPIEAPTANIIPSNTRALTRAGLGADR